MSSDLYRRVETLEFSIKRTETSKLEKKVSSNFTRRTTVLRLEGSGATGSGEDVIYEPEKHRYPELELEGSWTFGEFSHRLEGIELFPPDVEHSEKDRKYRRWAVESAALDLALRQNSLNLGEALDREYSDLRFVVSPRMEGADQEKISELVGRFPEIEFKLDASSGWDREFVEGLPAGKVRVVDMKALYKKERVRMEPDLEVYRLVAERLDSLVEDPSLVGAAGEALEGIEERVSWDYPIESVESVEELPFQPGWLNIKPSRFGSVKSLLETVEHCMENGIRMYGGGQFELGPGRHHIQALASLFYPDRPNDLAPRVYNQERVPDDAPQSPLAAGRLRNKVGF